MLSPARAASRSLDLIDAILFPATDPTDAALREEMAAASCLPRERIEIPSFFKLAIDLLAMLSGGRGTPARCPQGGERGYSCG